MAGEETQQDISSSAGGGRVVERESPLNLICPNDPLHGSFQVSPLNKRDFNLITTTE